ncbi:aldehyde dehydrogenase family protein [Pseudonocardia sp. MH-G8]|uniref:aldehyde dehydrogenase family protein n=1 Tax=Pseudonocardia sp. MH-G8 TaxID=1854588 RepID=UPI000BA16B3E|nr:aldehyde dehydrogenase family protein [Pseudonocardia sp. MH-G8]OZM79536.1 aldehyde dehydrogenase [Pseudonocardia sp. MH-G8]
MPLPTQALLFSDGAWREGASTQPLHDKFDGAELAQVHVPDRAQVDRAVRAVAAAQASVRQTGYERGAVLMAASALMRERRDRLVDAVVADTGFTLTDAGREVDRAIETLQLCGEEAKRLAGRMVPVEGGPGVRGRIGFTLRKPLGVVCAITPFNAPVNTVCHKVGPALAAGNGIVLKPAPETPLTAVLLVELLLDAGVPEGLIALLPGGAEVGQALLEHPVPAFYAFTGSTRVGEHIARIVGIRRTQLELGSLASTIVCADAALEAAAGLCVNAAFRKAGQVCTSVQRLYVQREVMAEFGALVARGVADRVVGDPRLPETFVGPVISTGAADRIESWVTAAVEGGAELVHGGTREGSVITPTILGNVSRDMTVMTNEVFGPVVVLRPFDTLAEAVAEANDTPFGLAAGVFTADLDSALTAAQQLRVGTVHINETSSSRVDLMPFGGVKASGTGVEGPRYAIEEMTEETLVTVGPARP